MDFHLVLAVILILSITYFITQLDTEVESSSFPEKNVKVKQELSCAPVKVVFVAETKDSSRKFLAINEMTRVLFFTETLSEAETFTKVLDKKKKNLFTLMTDQKCFLNLKYTTFPKQEYDISVSENIDNTAKLIIKKTKKNKSYIRFFNGYYLCIDSYDNLFASKDKTKVLFFSFKLN